MKKENTMRKSFLLAASMMLAVASAWAINFVNINSNKLKYTTSHVTVAGTSVTLSGIGYSWMVQPLGGSATFKVSNGSTMSVTNGQSIGDNFGFFAQNPVIFISALDAGTTVFVYISGGDPAR